MKLDPRLIKEGRHAELVILASICLGLVGGILGILQARQLSRIINQVFLVHNTLQGVSYLLATVLAIIILRVGFSWAGEVCGAIAAYRIKQDLRHRLVSQIFDLGPAYLRSESGEDQVRTGELVNTMTEGIDALEIYFSQYLPQLALAALIPIAILLYAVPIDTLSGVIFLVTAPLLPLFMYLIGSAAEALTRKQWLGLGRMSAYFLDVLQGLTTLKSFGRSREQVEIIRKVSENYRKTTMRVLRVTFLSALVLELVATLSTAVVAVEIGIRLLYGRLLFEQAFFLLLLAPEFYQPLRLLGTRFHVGMAGVEAAKRIFEILDLQPPRRQQAVVSPAETEKQPPSILVKEVSYTYSNGTTALQGISLAISPGKITALAGESGSGKTTLTWLVLGFLPAQAGQILVNGKPLGDLPYSEWLNRLSWVPQNPYLFNDTIRANIALARPEANDKEIYEAARQAHADEFIQALPMGYQTQIGERGIRLSAGQAQRITLARAFLKDASLLILDEATSHLDPESDSLFRSSMQYLCASRTVLVIAHHQNTLAQADRVIRLNHGRIVEITDHPRRTRSDLPTQQPGMSLGSSRPGTTPSNSLTTFSHSTTIRKNEHSPARRLLGLLAPFTRRIALSVLLGFGTVASGVGLMATAAYIISVAALHPSIAELQIAIVGVRFFGLSRGVFRYLERLISHDATLRILARWRLWFYQALEPLAPARLMSIHSGDLLSRVISDINSLESFYVRSIAPPLVGLLITIAMTLFLGRFGASLAWGFTVFALLAGIGLPWLSLAISRQQGPKIIDERTLLSTLLVDGLQGMSAILTCGRASGYSERIYQAGEQLSRSQARQSIVNAALSATSTLLANLAMLVILTLGIHRVIQGQMDGVLLGMVALATLTSFEAMQPLPQAAQYFSANRAAASRLYELVDTPPDVAESPQAIQQPSDFNLEIRDLSFQYPATEGCSTLPDIRGFSLQDIAFNLPQGKHLAIVGASGAGKTTLINLLLRFWEYSKGSIYLGQHELRQYQPDALRKCLGVVSQNTYLFAASLKDNLLIAKPSASDEELNLVARQAQLLDFINSLPCGYNTWIGEHGLRLSSGERQRLAVARALLMHAPILLLDEPTANLDPTTAQSLMTTIRQATRGLSTILITQSLVDLEEMDEILVLKDGKIIERGRHGQLLAAQGTYCHMWELYHHTV